jgi:hypothetical protein
LTFLAGRSASPAEPLIDIDELRRGWRERELAARFAELAMRNQALFMEQRPFMAGNYLPKNADWRG